MHTSHKTVDPRHLDGEALVPRPGGRTTEHQSGNATWPLPFVEESSGGQDAIITLRCLTELLLSCFPLPDLTTLGLPSIFFKGSDKYHPIPRHLALHTAERLTALHFQRAQFPTSLVRQVLQHTSMLKTFVHEHVRVCRHTILDLDELCVGLEHVRLTLVDLVVRIGADTADSMPNHHMTVSVGELGSLKSLTALKNVSASFAVFFGEATMWSGTIYDLSSVLPYHLGQLVIADDLWYSSTGSSLAHIISCVDSLARFFGSEGREGTLEAMFATPIL
ncbi:hypothetical protein BU25DRAFT_449771 [Macroventuria anomochaeta]|uniref:Uncharacterized protein n=1 Tax=Macroventuria anomochaeta TaxID=301207 RepID=A0ACB6RWN5_9PLEO|nr:uncharacterized protein BU25DRAFT_449771 [Macroventuria anomochaeta]KAF2625677.1 hypothetical protein BU25DRAFT_449771 [Macroventuria anomochaeta]